MDVAKVFKAPKRTVLNQIPADILENKDLNDSIALLPKNYKFEIHKSIWQIRINGATKVALQFPEGLLMYSCLISDILEEFGKVETVIMGDVTYGACCIDDFNARALGCDFMIHYGHSCLVPVDVTGIKCLYVFVEICIDLDHFIGVICENFSPTSVLVFVSTVQFISSCHAAQSILMTEKGFLSITVPQSKPLSSGEILGCTAPTLTAGCTAKGTGKPIDAFIYLGDGRFHLEAMMIANPDIPAYRYDPYGQVFTREYYETAKMLDLRQEAINKARQGRSFGIILGTLGRQGSVKVLNRIIDMIKSCHRLMDQNQNQNQNQITIHKILLSEIYPDKLELMDKSVDAWIQIACPRLSIDWGHFFRKPLLNPFEAAQVFRNGDGDGKTKVLTLSSYPMDFYANSSSGNWTPNHPDNATKAKITTSKSGSGGVSIKFSEWKRLKKAAAANKQ